MIDLFESKFLVTGSAGFIGSHLTEALLKKGCKVKALVKYNSRSDIGFLSEIENDKNLEIVFGDVRDPFAVEGLVSDCDAVFHLAALIGIPYSYIAPQSYVETNVTGTLNILEAAKKHKIKKVVVTSTSEVYGTALHTPMSETHPLQAQSPYSASKISADMMATAYSKSFSLPVSIVRPFNTFGPRQSMRAVIPTIINQALKGDIVNLGDVSTVRDFNYIDNTILGFIAAMERGKSTAEVYNISSGTGITIQNTANKIFEIIGKDVEIRTVSERIRPKKSEVLNLIGDSSKARTELDWKPTISFENGLIKTIEWVKNNLAKFPNSNKYVR